MFANKRPHYYYFSAFIQKPPNSNKYEWLKRPVDYFLVLLHLTPSAYSAEVFQVQTPQIESTPVIKAEKWIKIRPKSTENPLKYKSPWNCFQASSLLDREMKTTLKKLVIIQLENASLRIRSLLHNRDRTDITKHDVMPSLPDGWSWEWPTDVPSNRPPSDQTQQMDIYSIQLRLRSPGN